MVDKFGTASRPGIRRSARRSDRLVSQPGGRTAPRRRAKPTFAQGDPADAMFVILEGQLQARGEIGGETVVFSMKPGDVTGVLPFSRMKQFTVGGRAQSRTPRPALSRLAVSRACAEDAGTDPAPRGPDVRQNPRNHPRWSNSATVWPLWENFRPDSRMNSTIQLPPPSAPPSQLRDVLKKIRDASHELGRRDLTAAQKSEIEKLEASFVQSDEVSARSARHQRPRRPDRFLVAQPRAERFVATGGRSGAQERQAGSAGIAVRHSRCGYCARRAGEDRRFGGSRHPAERNRERHLANLRSGPRHQGIHLHGPDAAAKCRHREKPETTLTILNHKLKRGVTVQRDYPMPLAREFIRERAESGLDQPHRQRH